MPNIYVRSTDGNDADDGSTWALAKATLAGAAAIDAAGDSIYVSQAHNESTAAAITIALAGTTASPVRLICGDDTVEPPTAVATTATVTTTGGSSITVSGSCYVYGLAFFAGSGASNTSINLGGNSHSQVYERCAFSIIATGSSSNITAVNGSNGAAHVGLKNCDFSFGSSVHRIELGAANFVWDGGSVLAGSATPTAGMFRVTGRQHPGSLIRGVDFSQLSSSLVLTTASQSGKVVFRNCKMPIGWSTGNLYTGTKVVGFRAELYNCDSGDTNYVLQVEDFCGTVLHETTIVRSGGAVDGTTRLAWKMVSNANANYPLVTLDTPEIVRWNDTVGNPITVTVETLTDNLTLTNEQCWIEVQYLGTPGFPISSFISDAKVDVLATAANQDTSTSTWVTTGVTTPVRQKLSVTFTPQEKGFLHAVVKLARPSTTVYVDPKITVS